GIAGVFERSWSGEPGTLAWTRLLIPAAAVYAIASGAARLRASARRRDLPGAYVNPVGNLTVGGAGKSPSARSLALGAPNGGGRRMECFSRQGPRGGRWRRFERRAVSYSSSRKRERRCRPGR